MDDRRENEGGAAAAGSLGSLTESSRDHRINMRRNRIQVTRAARQKPTDEDGMSSSVSLL